jgi:hypothetical protein
MQEILHELNESEKKHGQAKFCRLHATQICSQVHAQNEGTTLEVAIATNVEEISKEKLSTN